MPTYDYRCEACGHRVEVVHSVHGHGPSVCPSCGIEGRMRKLLSAPTIVYKGSGWAKKDRSATAAPAKSGADKATEPATATTTAAETRSAESKASEPTSSGSATD